MRKPMGDTGVIGLGVMGRNLVLNMNDHGYRVVVFNRSVSRVDAFLEGAAKGTRVVGTHSLEEMVARLEEPRRVLLMVKAGKAVDEIMEVLLPLLSRGDLIMDGGNSHFRDTMRRAADLEKRGFLYMGVGISGGEEGARSGPSIMPGGSPGAWPLVKDMLQNIAAKTAGGLPCCDWVGQNGAGHYVKMVHNGIEYSEMQLLAEVYHLMRDGIGLSHDEMHRVFAGWNRGALEGYLMEITRDVLAFKDEDGKPMLEKILDVAGQKGTGQWTSIESLELGMPLGMITEAVYARFLSGLKEGRRLAARVLRGPRPAMPRAGLLTDMRKALLASKTVSYAQGFMLMGSAAGRYGWSLDLGRIALLWQNGCILRNALLQRIAAAYQRVPVLQSLLLDPHFVGLFRRCHSSLRRTVAGAVGAGIPVPVFSAALAFYDGYRSARLPANLLQAQRDYFGAHTYERVDRPRGEFSHTQWKGQDPKKG